MFTAAHPFLIVYYLSVVFCSFMSLNPYKYCSLCLESFQPQASLLNSYVLFKTHFFLYKAFCDSFHYISSFKKRTKELEVDYIFLYKI